MGIFFVQWMTFRWRDTVSVACTFLWHGNVGGGCKILSTQTHVDSSVFVASTCVLYP